MKKKKSFLESPWKALWFAIRPYRGRVVLGWALIAIAQALVFSVPYFLGILVDRVSSRESFELSFQYLSFPLFGVAIALLFYEIFSRIAHAIEVYVASGVFRHITDQCYEALIQRPASYFENKFSGDLGRRVSQIGSASVWFIEHFPWYVCWIVVGIGMAIALLSTAHIYLVVTFLVWFLLFCIVSVPFLRLYFRKTEESASSHARISGNVVDVLSNIPLVSSFGGVPYERYFHGEIMKSFISIDRRARWTEVYNKMQQGLSVFFLFVSLVSVSIFLFIRGELVVSDFVVVAGVLPSLTGIVWNFGGLAVDAIRRFGEISDATHHLRMEQAELLYGSVAGVPSKRNVVFLGVSFRYPGTGRSVFDKFSLEIREGERVGIVGKSGVGKSTLVKLLLRHYSPKSGRILVGGVPIEDFTVEIFSRLIGYVPQDTSLFHRTLFQNIQYAKPDATKEEVLRASKQAHADDFIRELPQGYETMVGERGVKLSGGQRQRVAVARAIVKNAPILVLDEATSALDSESEEVVQKALYELFQKRTVIAIAHRLSTLRAMDRILVMEEGSVVESGNPKELLEKEGGVFRRMWEQQKAGFV